MLYATIHTRTHNLKNLVYEINICYGIRKKVYTPFGKDLYTCPPCVADGFEGQSIKWGGEKDSFYTPLPDGIPLL